MHEEGESTDKLLWEVELKKLNESLPRERRPVSDLLNESRPAYKNLAGETVYFNREELDEFVKAVPKASSNLVRLPIVIVRESSLKKGTYLIDGNEGEIEAVNRLLDRPPYKNKYLFRPEVLELIRRFPTIIAFGFIL
ncbi:MAG: DUF61 family protein [Candidatus Methanosuratincola sp.]|jgi:uncharacterized protein (UPF0216 family)|uniref:DUF61 family protein n=2 Tax=Candidatus Methanosuratincola (ex Vanwonterghem et al. 2016) TaxID=1915412 RepID=A0A7J3UZV8_9CREN|nr:DUF61 family protein [Candidatus Methanosuratincola sp.]RWX72904.1 MAG: hypothetical protein Metus_0878 [Candidatus Methanosuratincola subterraneus]